MNYEKREHTNMNTPNKAASEKMACPHCGSTDIEQVRFPLLNEILPVCKSCGKFILKSCGKFILASLTNDAAQPSSAAQVEGIDPTPSLTSIAVKNAFDAHDRNAELLKQLAHERAVTERWRYLAGNRIERVTELSAKNTKLLQELEHERAVRKGLVEALRHAKSGLIQLADRPVHWYVDQIDAALAATEKEER